MPSPKTAAYPVRSPASPSSGQCPRIIRAWYSGIPSCPAPLGFGGQCPRIIRARCSGIPSCPALLGFGGQCPRIIRARCGRIPSCPAPFGFGGQCPRIIRARCGRIPSCPAPLGFVTFFRNSILISEFLFRIMEKVLANPETIRYNISAWVCAHDIIKTTHPGIALPCSGFPAAG